MLKIMDGTLNRSGVCGSYTTFIKYSRWPPHLGRSLCVYVLKESNYSYTFSGDVYYGSKFKILLLVFYSMTYVIIYSSIQMITKFLEFHTVCKFCLHSSTVVDAHAHSSIVTIFECKCYNTIGGGM